MVQRKMVTQSLGNSGPQQRVGAPVSDVSAEEHALSAAHEAARALYLLWEEAAVNTPSTAAKQAELASLLDGLYARWQSIGAWNPGDPRVPVSGEPGDRRVEWEWEG